MEENQVVAAAAINKLNMKKSILFLFLSISFLGYSQTNTDAEKVYKKRVLENVEVDIISSFYSQNGDNASVTGGIGNEKLTDLASNIVISIPLNDNDVLTIDGTISAYTSASSSNLNPFDVGTGGDGDNNSTSYNANSVGSP